MEKLLTLMLIGWLVAAEVSAGLCHWKKKKKPYEEIPKADKPKPANFKALNEYLMKNLPETDDLAANLAQIRSNNMSQLAPGVREAGQMVLYLLERPADECSDEIMLILLELHKWGLHVEGQTRVEQISRVSWTKALEMCNKYIETTYKKSPVGKTSFLLALNAGGSWHGVHRDDDIYLGLRQLASESPQTQFEFVKYSEVTGKGSILKDRDIFEYAFNQLLVKPCKQINSNDGLLDNMAALTSADLEAFITRYKSQAANNFSVNIELEMNNMNWIRYACTRIINMDKSEMTFIYNSVKE